MAHCNILFILALVSGIINFANGKTFTCEDGRGSPCIILEMDATFNLTMSGNETQTSMFSLETASVDKNACICQDHSIRKPSMSIKTFPSNDTLTVLFSLETANVYMKPLFYMRPHKHFNTSDHNNIEFVTSADLPIGNNGSSYKCMSSQNIAFQRTGPYGMTMTMMNLHVQAYGIKNGNLSPATSCPADMPTVRPVTTGTTTPMSHTMSTHEPHSTITPVIIFIMYFLYM
ncbi:hypothetical protein MAR_013626 [Mya arenaria]|uniref:Uncharacterized protein n=1 Tax=Mya arenaria TaxID=6604 RepID=A0ABY7G0F6_MYAAR|nr:uncharacterized protein LOC128220513 [Mya arenaria]WAR27922.1 hypothetical protein MAR_013626 [Mya arenaria]